MLFEHFFFTFLAFLPGLRRGWIYLDILRKSEVPGIFRICFCRPMKAETCQSSSGYKARVGLMTASGPFEPQGWAKTLDGWFLDVFTRKKTAPITNYVGCKKDGNRCGNPKLRRLLVRLLRFVCASFWSKRTWFQSLQPSGSFMFL